MTSGQPANARSGFAARAFATFEEVKMKNIETKRLLLRPFTADDWQDLQKVAMDWKSAPGPAFDKWPTADEACRKFTQYLASRDNCLAVCLKTSGEVVGLLVSAPRTNPASERVSAGHRSLSALLIPFFQQIRISQGKCIFSNL
jgi:RimJ/RimL family protein N-acetyltransferase